MSWVFAKSINNSAVLSAKYGIVGGFGYCGWCVCPDCVAMCVDAFGLMCEIYSVYFHHVPVPTTLQRP